MTEVVQVRLKDYSQLLIETDHSTGAELTDFFSFFAEGYKFHPAYRNKQWDGLLRLYNHRDKQLPIGLYAYLQNFCEARGYILEVLDNQLYGLPIADNKVPPSLDYLNSHTFTSRGKPIEHRDYQLRAITTAITEHRTLLLSPTASGKSLIIYSIMLYYMENYDKDILIIVPTTSLVNQMYGDFADYSEFDQAFSAEDSCHMIYSGKEKNHDKRITISTWQSVYKLGSAWFKKFGMIIGDEAHTFKAKSLVSIMGKSTEAQFRIGTTGTIDNIAVNKLVLEGSFGPVYRVTSTKALMDEGSLAALDIKILALKYPDVESKIVSKLKYPQEMDYIVTHEKRNNFIANLAIAQTGNTLILFQFVGKHGKPLHELINTKVGDDREVFYVSGETDANLREDVRRITETKSNAILVCSLGTFSTGVNIRNLHNIIFASPSKAQIKILQSIGRGLRKSDNGQDTKLFDIADDFHWKSKKNYTLRHAAERVKIYASEKFNFKIHEVKM